MKSILDAVMILSGDFAGAWRQDVSGPAEYRHAEDFEVLGVYRVGLNGLQPRPLDRVSLQRHIRKRAERLGSAEAAFDELIKAVECNRSTASFCMVLVGLRVNKTIDLTLELSLQPLSSFIFTPWATKHVEEKNGYLSRLDGEPLLPGCVLVWKVPFEPVLAHATGGLEQPTLQQTAYLDTVLNLLSTAACRPVAPVLVYITDDDELFPVPGDGLVYRNFGWGGAPTMIEQADAVASEIVPFFQDYFAFKGSYQAINLATRRLSRSMGIGIL